MTEDLFADLFAGLPPIFRDCVQKGSYARYPWPFVIGPHVYATDGRVACRTLLASVPDYVPTDNKGPKADDVFAAARTAGIADIPDVPGPVKQPCSKCHGSQEVECNLGRTHACPDCEDGTEIKNADPVLIDGHRIGGEYLHLLRKNGFTTINLPSEKLGAAPKGPSKANPNGVLTASHDGVEIVLVTMYQEDK